MDIARELGDLLTLILTPPGFAPGSLAGGSATEDRMIDRWRADVERRFDGLRAHVQAGSREETALTMIRGLDVGPLAPSERRALVSFLKSTSPTQETPPPPSATGA